MDERAFAEEDEFLPYWAELWPAARARAGAGRQGPARRARARAGLWTRPAEHRRRARRWAGPRHRLVRGPRSSCCTTTRPATTSCWRPCARTGCIRRRSWPAARSRSCSPPTSSTSAATSRCCWTCCRSSSRRRARSGSPTPAGPRRTCFALADADGLATPRDARPRPAERRGAPLHAATVLPQAEVGHGGLAHLELLHLAGDGHRERVDDLHVARHLVVRDAALAELADLVLRDGRAVLHLDPGAELLAVAIVRDAEDRDVVHRGWEYRNSSTSRG